MADFSLELNEDQLQMQKWVHDFAADVVRPAAPEWDEREETPWPIIEEAAKIGLYSWEFIANVFGDPTGLTFPVISEELCWGDAGIALAIFGTTLGVSGIVGNGTPEQIARVGPAVLRHARRHSSMAAFAVSEPDAGSDVSSLRTPRGLRRGEGRVGAERHQDVDHQRRHHARPDRARRRRRGRARAQEPRPRVVRRPARHARPLDQGQKFKKMGIRASHTAEVVLDDVRVPGSCLLGGKEKLDARLARAREGQELARAGGDEHVRSRRRPLVGAQALGIARAAYEYALEYAKERIAFGRPIIMNQAIAFKLADMKMQIDAARLLVWRACWMARNRQAVRRGRRLDVEAVRR